MFKKIVALTPIFGAFAFPIAIPIIMVRQGIETGIIAALFLSSLWFIAMLRTSEMPH